MKTINKKTNLVIIIISTIIIFFVTNRANAQTEFAPIGAEWYYTYTFGFCPKKHFNHIIYEKDTIIDDNNCRVLRKYYDNSDIANETYIIKQEQNKVYYYYQNNFNLLFDFDVQVNDTITFSLMGKTYFFDSSLENPFYNKDTTFSIRCVVEDITINPHNIKTFITSVLEEDRLDAYFPYSYIYSEKIGLYNEFILKIHDEYFLPEYPPSRFLRCYSDSMFSFVSDEWSAMSLPCDYSIINDINIPKNEEDIMFYPNPFNDNISIFTKKARNIEIMDISGKIVYSSILSIGINKIYTNKFLKGVYFIKTKNKNNIIKTFKIIKL